MALKVAILGVAHVHAGSYAHHLGAQLSGVYDSDAHRGEAFAQRWHSTFGADADAVIATADAVIISSETAKHEDLIGRACKAGKPILCEKPIAATRDGGERIRGIAQGSHFMTAFPCRFAPGWERVKQRVKAGEIGDIVSVCATNHGRCAGGWFLEKDQGGGALLDHVVHAADLLRDLMGAEPQRATAASGNNMHRGEVEDIAMATFDFADGRFATIDSSWSRPRSYRTWGDLTMNIVGQKGLIEVDLFGQEIEVIQEEPPGHRSAGYGSNLDAMLVAEFLSSIEENRAPKITLEDGLAANEWAWLALDSVAATGETVPA